MLDDLLNESSSSLEVNSQSTECRDRQTKTGKYQCILTHTQIILAFLDVTGKKAAVKVYLRNIEESIADIDDPHTLDRVISLLTQAIRPIERYMK